VGAHLGKFEVRRNNKLDVSMTEQPQDKAQHVAVIRPCAAPHRC
jgi:hypothetical protein